MPPSSVSSISLLSYPFARLRQAFRRLQTPSQHYMTGSSPRGKNAGLPPAYPQTKRTDHVDTYLNKNGEVKVHDPYNWVEQETDERSGWLDSTLMSKIVDCR